MLCLAHLKHFETEKEFTLQNGSMSLATCDVHKECEKWVCTRAVDLYALCDFYTHEKSQESLKHCRVPIYQGVNLIRSNEVV